VHFGTLEVGTPVDTLHQLVHKVFFGTLGSFLVIFGKSGTVVTFDTPVAFWYTDVRISVYYTRHHS